MFMRLKTHPLDGTPFSAAAIERILDVHSQEAHPNSEGYRVKCMNWALSLFEPKSVQALLRERSYAGKAPKNAKEIQVVIDHALRQEKINDFYRAITPIPSIFEDDEVNGFVHSLDSMAKAWDAFFVADRSAATDAFKESALFDAGMLLKQGLAGNPITLRAAFEAEAKILESVTKQWRFFFNDPISKPIANQLKNVAAPMVLEYLEERDKRLVDIARMSPIVADYIDAAIRQHRPFSPALASEDAAPVHPSPRMR